MRVDTSRPPADQHLGVSDQEQRVMLKRRAIGFAAGVGATLLLIAAYLYFLQVIRGVEFRVRASNVAPPRDIDSGAARQDLRPHLRQGAGYQPARVLGGHRSRRGAGRRVARPAGATGEPSRRGAAAIGEAGPASHAAPVPLHRTEAQRGLCHHRHPRGTHRLLSRRGVAQRAGPRLRADRVSGARDRLRRGDYQRGTAGAVQRRLRLRRRDRQERRRKAVRVGLARAGRHRPPHGGRS